MADKKQLVEELSQPEGQAVEATAKERPLGAEIYDDLAAPFDVTFKDQRGGFEFDYATGEQVATRLNETLGFLAWSFKIIEHGIHAEADECWALGELTVHIGGGIVRQQFGVSADAQTDQPRQPTPLNRGNTAPLDTEALYCEECGELLTETRFKDGTNWAPSQLAVFGRRKHSRILCMTHYKEANQAKRRAEEALQQVPF
jgi:hypothetical protein